MKKKILFSAGAGFIALLVAIPLALAQGPGEKGYGRGDGERGPRFEKMAEKLGLDAKQSATLKTLHETHRAEAKSLHEQMKAAREKSKAAWLAPNATEASVRAAQREVQALQGQLADQRVSFGFAVKKVLTPDQFQKFASKFLDGKGGKGFGKGGKRGHHGKDAMGGKRGGRGGWGGERGAPDVE